jgi:hypothetical protein
MPNPNPALLPRPALFDVTTLVASDTEGRIERVPLDQLQVTMSLWPARGLR